MKIINRTTGIITVCGLLLCMSGRAQDISLSADSCGKISTGFNSFPKMAITGSVATVEGQAMMTPVSNLSFSLMGKLPGLNTLEESSELTRAGVFIGIRGYSTNIHTTPIVIVDGIITELSTIDFMNINEIENISIVKDGSSLAIYGIQSANGAIVITTKRGTTGPLKVNAWYHYSLQQMTKQPPFVSSAEYARLRNEAGVNSGLSAYSQFTQDQIDRFASGNSLSYPNNNWYDMFVRKVSSMHQAGFSVQGGNDRIKHFSTINYYHQSSPFNIADEPERNYTPTIAVDQASIRSNVDVKFNNYLSAFMLMNGTIRVDNGVPSGNSSIYSQILQTPSLMYGPLTPIEMVSSSGETSLQSKQVTTYEGGDSPPYGLLNRSGYNRVLNSWIYTQAGVTLDLGFLTDGLSLTGLMAYQMYGRNTTLTSQTYERYIRSNSYSEFEFTKYGNIDNSPLSYSKSHVFRYNLSLSARADYAKMFGTHAVQASAFYYYSKQEKEDMSGLGILPYLNEMMGVTALYGYRDKYFLKADIGYSGSEQFHPDYRYTATPAISAAWVVSGEDFMAGLDWLSLLKLRVSYGANANDQLGGERYLYADYINVWGTEGMRGNPRLSAEKIWKQDFGIDLGLLSSVSLSVDWFYHKCDNMLVNNGLIPELQTIPLYYYPKLNTGKMENRGIEIEMGYNDRLSQDLSVFAGAGFSFSRNKVVTINELAYTDRFYPYRSEGYRRGQPWGYLIDYSNGNGIFNSQQEIDASGLTYSAMVAPRVGDFIYRDLNKDGVIDIGDAAPIGNPRLPEIFYSFNAGAQWENFDFSFLLQGAANTSVAINGLGVYEYSARGVFSDLHQNAWTAERYAAGEKIDYPALSLTESANHVANSFFIMNASYLKMRNMEIGYSLPASLAKKMKSENIRISLSGQNLFTIDRMKTKYIDPETASMGAFQPYRVYSAGVRCTF
ncbi:MAG: SusC/RagA family TonB-linked outer membrane protein [Bacteroidales bacterium]|jgi:TonB-linked SusC/RagA family outer membrane protein|nr:SusC/RagA family TonB-linked outer membrane protein [Bacteroidales bacterium]